MNVAYRETTQLKKVLLRVGKNPKRVSLRYLINISISFPLLEQLKKSAKNVVLTLN